MNRFNALIDDSLRLGLFRRSDINLKYYYYNFNIIDCRFEIIINQIISN